MPMPEETPFFSVLIPTYRRPRQLACCLEALARLDYPDGRFEAIVVDDGSESPPEDVVDRFRGRLNVILLTRPHAGPAAARNMALAHARGEIVALIDDDCLCDPGWLKGLAERFRAGGPLAAGGRTTNGLPDNPYSSASQFVLDVVYSFYNRDPDRASFFASNNLAVTASELRAMGGFDPAFVTSEDRDLCDRWLSRGLPMVCAGGALIEHRHDLTLRSFWNQHAGYGRGARLFHRARANRRRKGIRLRPLSFYLYASWRLLAAVLRGRLALAVLVPLSQTAAAAGFLQACFGRAARRD